MKDERIIALKDPRLIGLRKITREILTSCCNSQIKRLSDQRVEIMNETHWKPTVQTTKLLFEQRHIEKILNKSICKCRICRNLEKNIIFDGSEKEWYCLDCYNGTIKKLRDPIVQDLLRHEL